MTTLLNVIRVLQYFVVFCHSKTLYCNNRNNCIKTNNWMETSRQEPSKFQPKICVCCCSSHDCPQCGSHFQEVRLHHDFQINVSVDNPKHLKALKSVRWRLWRHFNATLRHLRKKQPGQRGKTGTTQTFTVQHSGYWQHCQ